MSNSIPKPTFVLTLVPEGRCTEPEAYRRLRAALKALLRSYGLRCKNIAGAPALPVDGGEVAQ